MCWRVQSSAGRKRLHQPRPSPLAKTARCRRCGWALANRCQLDGTLSHAAWKRAPVYDRFVEKDPVYGALPPQVTRVQVLFDEQAIYVGVMALDSEPALIRDPIVRTDQVNRTQDFVAVYIDAIGSKRSAQWFRASAAGSMADGLHTASDDFEDFSPDFDWDAAVSRSAQGYTAVFRLPFASLRFAPGEHVWRMMVVRRLPREQFHLVTSVPIPRDLPSFIDNLQPLLGVQLPQDSRFLTLRPGLTVRRDEPAFGAARNEVSASLDAKWRPLPQAVVDATLNPDFSQVALDVPQLAGNSRFALFYPEKRPFFFESADLLRTPTEALYTRSFTEPRWGLRGTWRATGWAGTALALDDRGKGLVLLPSAYGTDATTQPASKALALRARSDGGSGLLHQGLQLGAVVAAREYVDDRGHNTVLGPDLAWQLDANWRVRAQWLHAQTSALPGSDGLRKGPARDGDLLLLRCSIKPTTPRPTWASTTSVPTSATTAASSTRSACAGSTAGCPAAGTASGRSTSSGSMPTGSAWSTARPGSWCRSSCARASGPPARATWNGGRSSMATRCCAHRPRRRCCANASSPPAWW